MKILFLGTLLLLRSAYAETCSAPSTQCLQTLSGRPSYAFLCNGVTAECVLESDECGSCEASVATRWPLQKVTYNVNTSVLPNGISATQWTSLVKNAFQAWASTPESNLTATYGSEGTRTFGTDNENHNIFWVNTESEWTEFIGAGYKGVLGVTLPPYLCPTSTVPYRAIEDGDMILNAVPGADPTVPSVNPTSVFPWKETCSSITDNTCQSIKATIAHESGHFLGLGHPNVCGSQLMAAKAQYLVESPQADDQVGLRALYPGNATGSLGTECTDSSTCLTGLTCHAQYCSQKCTQNSDCKNNSSMSCISEFCEFPPPEEPVTTPTTTASNLDVTSNSQDNGSSTSSSASASAKGCSSVKSPHEIWILLLLLGVWVYRSSTVRAQSKSCMY